MVVFRVSRWWRLGGGVALVAGFQRVANSWVVIRGTAH